jgi:hypothetical protein
MKIIFSIFAFSFLISISSCKKANENVEKYCWQLLDANGGEVGQVCDKTEAELRDCILSNKCGTFNISNDLSCNYYRADGEKFCWKIGNVISATGKINEFGANLLAKCYGVTQPPVKTTCIDCARWYVREKKLFKPQNTITYSPLRVPLLCGDTLTKLFQGRQIIRKDDADSLIVIQFSNDGQNW